MPDLEMSSLMMQDEIDACDKTRTLLRERLGAGHAADATDADETAGALRELLRELAQSLKENISDRGQDD